MSSGEAAVEGMSTRPRRSTSLSQTNTAAKREHPAEKQKNMASGYVHGTERYCICRRPYDPDLFMIGCDKCFGWFHAACVNVSIEQAKVAESYTCPSCSNSPHGKTIPRPPPVKEALPEPRLPSQYKSDTSESRPVRTRKRRKRRATTNVRYDEDDASEDEFGVQQSFFSEDVFDEVSNSEHENDSDVPMSSDEDVLHGTLASPFTGERIGQKRVLPPRCLQNWNQFVLEKVKEELDAIDDDTSPVAYANALRACIPTYEKELALVRIEQIHMEAYDYYASILSRCVCKEAKVPTQKPLKTHTSFLEWTYMPLCVHCDGKIPIDRYAQHIRNCQDEPDDPYTCRQPPAICGCPLGPFSFEGANVGGRAYLDGLVCREKAQDCSVHAGWRSIRSLQVLRREYTTRRILGFLQEELQRAEQRIEADVKLAYTLSVPVNPPLNATFATFTIPSSEESSLKRTLDDASGETESDGHVQKKVKIEVSSEEGVTVNT